MHREIIVVLLFLFIVLPVLNVAKTPLTIRVGEKIPISNPGGRPIIAWINVTKNYVIVSIPINRVLEVRQGIAARIFYSKGSEAGIAVIVSYSHENSIFLEGYHIESYMMNIVKTNSSTLSFKAYAEIMLGNASNKTIYRIETDCMINLKKSGKIGDEYRFRISGLLKAYYNEKLKKYPPLNISDYIIREILKLTPINKINILDNTYLGIWGPFYGGINRISSEGMLRDSYRAYHIIIDAYIPVNDSLYTVLNTLSEASNHTRLFMRRSIIDKNTIGNKSYGVSLSAVIGELSTNELLKTLPHVSHLLGEIDTIKLFENVEPIPYLNATIHIIKALNTALNQYTYLSSGSAILPNNTLAKPRHIYMILKKNIVPKRLINLIVEWLRKYSYSDKDRVSIVFGIHDYKSGRTRFIMKEITYKPGAGTNTALYITCIIGAVIAGILAWSFWRKRRQSRIIVVYNEKT